MRKEKRGCKQGSQGPEEKQNRHEFARRGEKGADKQETRIKTSQQITERTKKNSIEEIRDKEQLRGRKEARKGERFKEKGNKESTENQRRFRRSRTRRRRAANNKRTTLKPKERKKE